MSKLFRYEYKCIVCGWTSLSNDEKDKDIKFSICDDCFDDIEADLKTQKVEDACKDVILENNIIDELVYINRLHDVIKM